MAKLAIGDRLAAAAVGVVFGAGIGWAVAWLLGVYSNVAGPSRVAVDMKACVVISSGAFGFMGLVLGPSVGTVLGSVLGVLYEVERAPDLDARSGLAVVLLVALAAGAWWWLRLGFGGA